MISIWLFLLLKEHNSFKDEFHQEIILPTKATFTEGWLFCFFKDLYV